MSDFAELFLAPTREARRSLIWDWHEAKEAACCDEDGPFCELSREWAKGYLAAIAGAEAEGFTVRHTCNGHPNDRCNACWAAKQQVKADVAALAAGLSETDTKQ